MDNRVEYGFRWSVAANGGMPQPAPIECFVASAAAFNVNSGAQGVLLGAGDVVSQVSDGSVTLCAGAETTPVAPFGVVVGVLPYWDGRRMQKGEFLPSGTTYGTVLERQSKLLVVPIIAGVWEVDVDDTVAQTLNTYQTYTQENVSMINSGIVGELRASPKLDISTHATTNTLMFRIVGVSPTLNNQDFTGANVKLLVQANLGTHPFLAPLGV